MENRKCLRAGVFCNPYIEELASIVAYGLPYSFLDLAGNIPFINSEKFSLIFVL
jgi:hypothetical protein